LPGPSTLVNHGRRLTADPAELARIRSLAIPPAYQDVWICRNPRGHLQATGRDARGRKQYRYHASWRTHRDAAKFGRMLEFGRDRHVSVRGDELTFEFRGKSGIAHCVRVSDPALARIVRRCADIPGQELFQWIDSEGKRHRIDSADVNDYLRDASGGAFTAKDFRTWFATVEALQALRKRPARNHAEVKRELATTIAAVARRLGNTPTICRKGYIPSGGPGCLR
jgi:DNA topoisomerase-1